MKNSQKNKEALKALVTGSSGFIGSTLSENLIKKGYEVIGFDIKNNGAGTKFIQGDIVTYDFNNILKNVDVVFHLAGLLGTTELFHRIINAERVNVLGTLNLLESMRRNKLSKIIFTSKPNIWKDNIYTITKEICERYLELYRKIYNFKPVITRPYNVYGPREYLYEYRKAIPYFITRALMEKPIEVFGNGEQTMDAIYIDDVVEALIRCSEIDSNEVVEIGTGKPIKVKDIAKIIINLCDSDSEIVYLPMRRGEEYVGEIHANGNMKRIINYESKTNLKVGLKKTIQWYKKNLDMFQSIYKYTDEDFKK